MPLSTGNLTDALAALGKDEDTRAKFIALLKAYEAAHPKAGRDIREELTGPICDALHRDVPEITRKLKNGLKITCKYRSKIIRDFVLSRDDPPDHVWEPQTTKALLRFAASSETVLIGGAYIGVQAVLIAERIKKRGGTVHCFEPSPESIEMLMRNARDNKLKNLVFNRMGLWSEAGWLSLTGEDSHAIPGKAAPGETGAFPATSVNAYGAEHGIDKLDILMLDIEGGECLALQGASNYLRKPPAEAPIVIFEVHRSFVDWSAGLENTTIVRLLKGHGYQVFAIRDYQSNVPMGRRSVELVPLDDIYLEGPPHGFNMLAVKQPGLLKKAGFRICAGVSPKLLKHRDPKYHAPIA